MAHFLTDLLYHLYLCPHTIECISQSGLNENEVKTAAISTIFCMIKLLETKKKTDKKCGKTMKVNYCNIRSILHLQYVNTKQNPK